MKTGLVAQPLGHYRFLPGIDPYSCGVVADRGHEMVHVTLQAWKPWRDGFRIVDRMLREEGLPRQALCGMELRSPKPFSMEGFIAFNRRYCAVLEDWGLFVDGANPVARTNVCPIGLKAREPVLAGFSFVRPNASLRRRTWVVAGAGELVEGTLVSQGILRRGETSADALMEKAGYVCRVMAERMRGLGGTWGQASVVDAYTIHPIHGLIEPLLFKRMPAVRRVGVTWHYTRPPVVDIEFEMDLRGVVAERVI